MKSSTPTMPTTIPTHGITKPKMSPITMSAMARPIMSAGFPRDPLPNQGGHGEMPTEPPEHAARPEAASSVAPVASSYEHSLPPCLRTTIAPRRRASSPQARLKVDHDEALFGQLAHRVGRALARVAGVLDAAVGHLVGAEGRRLVDDHAAELELLGRAQGGVESRREDAGLEAVARRVGELDRLVQ